VSQRLRGYLVIAPCPIKDDRVGAAKFILEKLRGEAKDLHGLAGHYDGNRRSYENNVPLILQVLADHGDEWELDDDQSFAESYLQQATEERLTEIIEFINTTDDDYPTTTDIATRRLGNGRQIIFAGGFCRSEPFGMAYNCLKDASRFGLFGALGIG
jgi:hypothetical protein